MPSALITTATTGFVLFARLDGASDRRRDLVGAGDDGGHEDHDQCVDVRVGEDVRNDCLVGRCGRRAEEVDGVAEARFAGNEPASASRVSLGQLGKLEPCALAGVGAEDPEAAGIRDHADAAAAGQWLGREHGGGVEELLERSCAQDSGLVEQRVDGGVGAGERSRMGARGARPCRRRSGLQREDRLAASDPSRDSRERPRIAERLEVEEHEVGCLVVFPPLEQVVRRDVGLVADRDERGEPECALRGLLEERQTERAALGRESDPAGGKGAGSERRVQAAAGDGDAEAVGADEPGAVRAYECEQSSCRSRPSSPISAKPAEITQRARTP